MGVAPIRNNRIRQAATVSLVALAVLLAGCANRGAITTGSVDPSAQTPVASMDARQLEEAARRVGAAYERDPRDKNIGLGYASVLAMNGNSDQALAVMEQVAIAHPTDRDVLAAYGKAQAAAGQLEQALQTVRRAQTPDRPDWRLNSAEGAILDQLGQPEAARLQYRKALDIMPNEPSVLSNLGMSYLLQGDLRSAETHMQNAVQQPGADSRVRQNYALVVGLQGRFEEAERIAAGELDAQQASANVAYLRAMLAQQQSWSQLADADAGGDAAGTN